ncbi:MAG: DUF5721 family protein [Eubacterium sp.]
MKMYQIEEVKKFMSQLLLQETFDKFCVSIAEIRTIVPITIKGTMSRDWLSPEDAEKYKDLEYIPWKLLRPVVFELIKGKQTPDFLKIQFVYYNENRDCGGLRIQFESGMLTWLSTYTPAEFSLDRNAETLWDENCESFLKKHSIVSTQL